MRLDLAGEEKGSARARSCPPGWPLRHEADFRRFAGRSASLVLEAPVNGQTYFSGRIEAVEDGHVVLLVGKKNRAHRIPLDGIKRARLEVDF